MREAKTWKLLLTRYANERLLFRLAASRHNSQFVLKGAALFTLWTGTAHRTTRDLDFLGFGEPDAAPVGEVFAEVVMVVGAEGSETAWSRHDLSSNRPIGT